MGHSTELEHIESARRPHRCSWCAEQIEAGAPYKRYRYFDGGDAGTVKMHPECNDIADETAREEGGDYEFFAGENPRGCNCGHSQGCETCAERDRAAALTADSNAEGKNADQA